LAVDVELVDAYGALKRITERSLRDARVGPDGNLRFGASRPHARTPDAQAELLRDQDASLHRGEVNQSFNLYSVNNKNTFRQTQRTDNQCRITSVK
jgi:hypothetical protein